MKMRSKKLQDFRNKYRELEQEEPTSPKTQIEAIRKRIVQQIIRNDKILSQLDLDV